MATPTRKKPGRKVNQVELSDAFISSAQIPANAASRTLHGQDGMFLRLERLKQRKILGVTYNIAGARQGSRQMVLGDHPAISFAEAQEKARKVRAVAAEGKDPKSAAIGLKTGQGWQDKLQQETPPQIYDYGADPDRKGRKGPYMVAFQRGGMRHLVYLDDRRRVFEVIDTGETGIDRVMTQGEAREAVATIRKTLPKGDLARIEEGLMLSELRIAELPETAPTPREAGISDAVAQKLAVLLQGRPQR